MIVRVLSLLGCIALVSTAHATDLAIGSVSLALGMDRVAVMEKLRSHYHIVTVSGDDNAFFVSERKPPNLQVVGGVRFENGRVAWVQRNWGSFSGRTDPVVIGKAIFGVIESVTIKSGNNAQITTRVQRIPGAEFNTLEAIFPDRKVTLSVTDGGSQYGKQFSIDESISAKR